jgi:quinolinate synthase
MEKTGRKMDLWQGNCYVHVEFTRNSIASIREQYPDAKLSHIRSAPMPSACSPDEVCSTEKMVSYCRESTASAFIIVTESGMPIDSGRKCPAGSYSRSNRSLRLQ